MILLERAVQILSLHLLALCTAASPLGSYSPSGLLCKMKIKIIPKYNCKKLETWLSYKYEVIVCQRFIELINEKTGRM